MATKDASNQEATMSTLQFVGAVLVALGVALYIAEPLTNWLAGRLQ